MQPLRILITNVGIANRTGTEIVAMDLARAYQRSGHLPMIWAPTLDPALVADEAESLVDEESGDCPGWHNPKPSVHDPHGEIPGALSRARARTNTSRVET